MRLTLIHLTIFICCCNALDYKEYNSRREEIVRQESLLALGGTVTLTDKEDKVNNCLMRYKFNEVDYGFDNPKYFNFSHHFFTYKAKIKDSKVYQIIRDMPKGAALHIHDTALLDPDYILNITYKEYLYVCFEDNLQLQFSYNTPNATCSVQWQLVSDARRSSNSVTEFDARLRKHFTLVVDNPDLIYPTIEESWSTFKKYFGTVTPMISYRPVWEQYFYDALKRFREDNIMYVEIRSTLPSLYELDGTVHSQLMTTTIYRKIIRKFVKNYPDFIGAKLIFAPQRKVDVSTIKEYLALAKRIKETVPDIFAGFDLVGQEDAGNPLIEFVPQLLSGEQDFNYFFHAGETDWYGTSTDENLVDAILLGTKRIGHGYALAKHPLLMKEIVKNNIGLEVNVISNQVLSLVHDVRNHPLSTFFALGLPVVLSSDDPGAWEAEPISDDFYVAFVGVASRVSDLRLLKTLIFNSIKYSVLEPLAKIIAINKLNLRWNDFIDSFKCSKYL